MKITTEDIQVGFHARQILKGISIESKDKELVGIIGPNGSGKSTLLKCIYRILKPDAGAVYLDGEELHSMSVKSSARKMAVVAQHNYYNFDFTVREVVLMGRAPHKKALERDNAKDYRIVEEALKRYRWMHLRIAHFLRCQVESSRGLFWQEHLHSRHLH